MNKVLKKRLLRELKSNFTKYLALLLLIVMGMYLVVSVVGAAETVITGSQEYGEKNQVEDGQFSVFIPLTDAQKKTIEKEGYTLEEMFSLDMEASDDSALRAMAVRKHINLINLDAGALPQKDGECILEKRYAAEHGLQVGDIVDASGMEFQIVGIGSTPDYDAPYEQFSDTAVSSSNFGTIFITEDFYCSIKENISLKSENYCYAYRLGKNNTSSDLKAMLRDFSFEYEEVDDEYYLETINENLEARYEIEDGIQELQDGVAELSDGMNVLYESTGGRQKEITAARDGAAALSDGISDLQEKSEELLDEVFQLDIDNLTSFVEKKDNIRIGAAAGDVVMNKMVGLIAGIIIMVLFTYVISVFVVHQVQRESSVIGALYALGAKKKDLMIHYITLPSITAFAGGLIGTLIGFSSIGIRRQMEQTYAYFSLPFFENVYPVYLLIYGLVMPAAIAIIVNVAVINKKLSGTSLSLMRNEQGAAGKSIDIGRGSFVYKFQVRQLIREFRSSVTVVFGMFIALLVVMLGMDCYVLCSSVKEDTVRDTKYEYMYTLKYPMKDAPKNGEICYVETLSKERFGYTLDVSMMGIENKNPFFPNVHVQEGKNKVIISSAVSAKYNLNVGDKLILSDAANETDYAFTIQEITAYEAGLMVFMDIDSMRELFGREEDYYNCVLSEHKLNIEEGRLYSIVTKEKLEQSTGIFVDMMGPMVTTLTIAGVIIYFAVMYLMQGVMIDRASFGISLIKTFGYRTKEVKRLYLNGNIYTVLIGAVIGIPSSKFIMDKMFPYFVSNVACGIHLTFSWKLYLLIGAVILGIYFTINALLVRKLNKITPAEVLKNRE